VRNPGDMAEPDPLLHEALDWIVRLKAGEPTTADVEAFQRWRSQSSAHDEASKTAARIWRNAGIAAKELAAKELAAKELAAEELAAATSVVEIRRDRQALPGLRLSRRAALGGGVALAAAASLSYAVIDPPLGLWPSLQELSADYRTAKGERRKIDVASDVSVELNTQTSLALRPVQNDTEVELISGEASVAAIRPPSRPLVMLAAGGRITAARADFNARCLDGLVSVACLDGIVDIAQAGKTARVRTGEQVSYSSAGIEPSLAVDVGQVAAWQNGLLIFRDKTLGDVVNEVNRYRSGKIIITNAEIKRRLVNGTFQIDKLDNFVPQVQQLFGARATSLPGGVVLLS
jgi:transmembrane sensor